MVHIQYTFYYFLVNKKYPLFSILLCSVQIAEWSGLEHTLLMSSLMCSVDVKLSLCADCSVHQRSPVPASSHPHASSAHRKHTAVQGNTICIENWRQRGIITDWHRAARGDCNFGLIAPSEEKGWACPPPRWSSTSFESTDLVFPVSMGQGGYLYYI